MINYKKAADDFLDFVQDLRAKDNRIGVEFGIVKLIQILEANTLEPSKVEAFHICKCGEVFKYKKEM